MYWPAPGYRVNDVIWTPYHELAPNNLHVGGAPASGTWATPGANNALLLPMLLNEPMTVLKAFVCNGATVGTDSWDIGAYRMSDLSTGRMDLIRSTGAVLSAGSANVVQESGTWKIATANLTASSDSTDSATYTTASVTLKAGRLYVASVENSAASAGVISSITNSGAPSFVAAPATSTTQFNGTANRTSIWTCVPTVDYTGTLIITFGATQTGCVWSIQEFSGVDTTTNNGIVQAAVGTGNSTTPLATLAAFGSASNATFAAHGQAAAANAAPGSGFTEQSDTTAATPAQGMETEWNVGNDTTADATITSAQWGSVAIEIKADTSSFIIPASTPAQPIYFAFVVSGTTATIFRGNVNTQHYRGIGALKLTTAYPLPSSITAGALSVACRPLAGFSSRSLVA